MQGTCLAGEIGYHLLGPKILATLKLMGRIRKARDWYFFSTVISATMVRLGLVSFMDLETACAAMGRH